MKKVILSWLIVVIFFGCDRKNQLPVTENIFEPGQALGELDSDQIKESSGLTESVNNPDLLWTHNDGGDTARIFLIDKQAHLKLILWFPNIKLRDWEAITVGPGPEKGKNYVYIGDIGDNESEFEYKFIYRFEEPVVGTKDTSLTNVDCIKFQMEDGPRDSEAFLIDPITNDIYLFSKREPKVNLYRLPFPQSTTEVMQAKLVLPKLEFNQFEARSVAKKGDETLINGYHSTFYNQIVGCDISDDGSEILVKTYSSIYYWKRKKNESIPDALKRTPMLLPYVPEPQGESVTFDIHGNGYYTLSEERGDLPQRLFFYKRK